MFLSFPAEVLKVYLFRQRKMPEELLAEIVQL